MTHTWQWTTVEGPNGPVRVRLPAAPPAPRGRMIWNSDRNGTYIRAKDPVIGYPKRKRSVRKLLTRLNRFTGIPRG